MGIEGQYGIAMSLSKLRAKVDAMTDTIQKHTIKLLVFSDDYYLNKWKADLTEKLVYLGRFKSKENNKPLSKEEYYELLFAEIFEDAYGMPHYRALQNTCEVVLRKTQKPYSQYRRRLNFPLDLFFERMKDFFTEIASLLSNESATYQAVEQLIDKYLLEEFDR